MSTTALTPREKWIAEKAFYSGHTRPPSEGLFDAWIKEVESRLSQDAPNPTESGPLNALAPEPSLCSAHQTPDPDCALCYPEN